MVIAVVNQKGGVGKTTTAVNLSASIAVSERKTLIIDVDPQCNTTSGLGILYNGLHAHMYHVLINKKKIKDVIKKTQVPYLFIAPSHPQLGEAEIDLLDMDRREHVLDKVLERPRADYKYIFIDCPPSPGLLTINSLIASDFVIIPLQCEYFALEGLSLLLKTIDIIRRRYNPRLQILGILLTMFDRRTSLSYKIMEEIKNYFDDGALFETVIPRNVRLAEAPSHGKPVMLYDITSNGAESYLELASEVLGKLD